MIVYIGVPYIKYKVMNAIGQTPYSSDRGKTKYFSKLALKLRGSIKLHQELLWEGEKMLSNGSTLKVRIKEEWKDFSNVTRHCLVVAARAGELAAQMGLSDKITDTLMQAAILHDAGKKMEGEITKRGGYDWESFNEAGEKQTGLLGERGYSEDVVYLSGSAGYTALKEVREILEKGENISEKDKAFLILHYIDNYTVNDDEFESGTNPLETRIKKNKTNKGYNTLNEDGVSRFGQSTFDEQLEVGTMLDEWFQKELSQQDVPESIKQGIQTKIVAALEKKGEERA